MYKDIANPLWNAWANDQNLLELYRKRCRQETEEMTCAAQAAELLKSLISSKESLLDAGCGGGYYYWSLKKRNVPVNYTGIDYTPAMIDLAKTEISSTNFELQAIENLNQNFDNIICFNVLTNSPHYALPLERLLKCCNKRLLLRESLTDKLTIKFTEDKYIDPDKRHIKAYFNSYPLVEVKDFIASYGFKVTQIKDKRSQDGIEMVCDIPHYWKILLAEKI